MTTSPRNRWVFVEGSESSRDPFSDTAGLMDDRDGYLVASCFSLDVPNSSPRRHWPQKAVRAAASTATSKASESLRYFSRSASIYGVTGWRGGHVNFSGASIATPHVTRDRWVLAFQGALCAVCQALTPASRPFTVVPERVPRKEAANAHKMYSAAGNCRFS
jgi:hypothetical protein